MGILAVGAIIGGGAISAGAAVSTIAMVSVGLTVVGMATKNQKLMKLGAGLGVGAGAASALGLGESAAATAAAESWSASGAAEVAGTGGASALEAGNPAMYGAASSMPAGMNAEAIPGALANADASSLAQVPFEEAPAAPATPPVVENTPVPDYPRSSTPPSGVTQQAATQRIAQPSTFEYTTGQQAPAPAPQAGTVAQPSTVQSNVQQTVDAGNVRGDATSGPVKGSTFFSGLGDWFGKLTPTGKLAVAQTASGLISGVGQGAFSYMGAQNQREYEQNMINERRRLQGTTPRLFANASY